MPKLNTAIVHTQPGALDRHAAAAYVALSLSGFEALVRSGSIPEPRLLGERRVAWLRAELDEWLATRPKSELLPPHNTGAPKPRPRRAANDEPIGQSAPAARTAA